MGTYPVMTRALAYGLFDEAPEWWGELHDKAAAQLSAELQNPCDITDTPRVIRDFLSIGLIVGKVVTKNRSPARVYYRLANPGDRLHDSTGWV